MRISDWSSDVCSSDLISDQLLDFDRRKTRVNRIDLNLLVGDVGDGVDRQLGELPDSETRDDEEEEEDRPACLDGKSYQSCDHGLFLLACALADLGLEQACVLGSDEIGRASCRERVCPYV